MKKLGFLVLFVVIGVLIGLAASYADMTKIQIKDIQGAKEFTWEHMKHANDPLFKKAANVTGMSCTFCHAMPAKKESVKPEFKDHTGCLKACHEVKDGKLVVVKK